MRHQFTEQRGVMTMGVTTVDAVEEATRLRVAMVRIQRQLRLRTGADVTPSQGSALARTEQLGPLRLGALAAAEGTTPATMSRIIDSLALLGLIERVPDVFDGRASLVQLSAEGAVLLHELRAKNTEALRGAMDELSEREYLAIRHAIPVFERLSDLLGGAEPGEGS